MAGYRAAIRWIAENDDTEWIKSDRTDEGEYFVSVTCVMVADLFDKDPQDVARDIERQLDKEQGN